MIGKLMIPVAAVLLATLPGADKPAPRTHTIVIDNMKFGPVPGEIHVGDTIQWLNKDIFRHTATARDKSFDIDLLPKASGKIVVKQAGVVPFYCIFHPGMKGQLVVAK